MTKIGIVTDSTADLPTAVTSRYGIQVIPLTVELNGDQYLDRVNISNAEFYARLSHLAELPKTSLPKPELFTEAYQRLVDDGCEVIYSLHLSAELSGTVNAARLIAQSFKTADIRVWDSRTATMGLGLLTQLLAERVEAGATPEACDAFFEEAIQKLKIYFLLDSLDNLEKGGRIGKAGYLVGSILNIKPILILFDGVISVHKKMRGNNKERVIKELTDAVMADVDPGKPVYIVAGYNNDLQSAEQFIHALQKRLPAVDPDYFELGAVVTTHIGLGAYGAAFFQTER